MCGINGFNFYNQTLINRMNKSIEYRGPNGKGTYLDTHISLGQVRLSIIDLSNAGKQPMNYKDKNNDLEIIFNGEIYNYIEIKNELLKKGYVFKSDSDTEVILVSYLEYGINCVKKFNGMWAFCIYDKKKKILFCSRDRLGVKPFVYYYKNKKFIFSSEIKALLEHKSLKINSKKNINSEMLDFYFSNSFIPSPHTIYNDVYKLNPGHNLVFNLKSGTLKKSKYYELPDYNPAANKKELIDGGVRLLKDAVKIRMRSDVPVGAFLSGGLDSTSVVGCMKNFTELNKLNTFSIGFSGKYDESKYISIAKNFFKTKHFHKYFTKKEFEKYLKVYSFLFDEPFCDYSIFPSLEVSKMAKKKVTVVLSGDGGDEIFAGYRNYNIASMISLFKIIPKKIRERLNKINTPFKILKYVKRLSELSVQKNELFFLNDEKNNKNSLFQKWSIKNMKYCLKKTNNNLLEAIRVYDLLFNNLSDNFCTKVDKTSMYYAIETRSPYLDYRFAEFSQKIPTKWKANINNSKIIMKSIIKKYMPKSILNRKKQGFTPPIKEWVNDNYKTEINNAVKILKGLNPNWYNFFNSLNKNNKNEIDFKIKLLLFEKWYKNWIN